MPTIVQFMMHVIRIILLYKLRRMQSMFIILKTICNNVKTLGHIGPLLVSRTKSRMKFANLLCIHFRNTLSGCCALGSRIGSVIAPQILVLVSTSLYQYKCCTIIIFSFNLYVYF